MAFSRETDGFAVSSRRNLGIMLLAAVVVLSSNDTRPSSEIVAVRFRLLEYSILHSPDSGFHLRLKRAWTLQQPLSSLGQLRSSRSKPDFAKDVARISLRLQFSLKGAQQRPQVAFGNDQQALSSGWVSTGAASCHILTVAAAAKLSFSAAKHRAPSAPSLLPMCSCNSPGLWTAHCNAADSFPHDICPKTASTTVSGFSWRVVPKTKCLKKTAVDGFDDRLGSGYQSSTWPTQWDCDVLSAIITIRGLGVQRPGNRSNNAWLQTFRFQAFCEKSASGVLLVFKTFAFPGKPRFAASRRMPRRAKRELNQRSSCIWHSLGQVSSGASSSTSPKNHGCTMWPMKPELIGPIVWPKLILPTQPVVHSAKSKHGLNWEWEWIPRDATAVPGLAKANCRSIAMWFLLKTWSSGVFIKKASRRFACFNPLKKTVPGPMSLQSLSTTKPGWGNCKNRGSSWSSG